MLASFPIAISCGGESYLILADKHTWLVFCSAAKLHCILWQI